MRTRNVLALVVLTVFATGGWTYASTAAKGLKADDLVEIQQLYAKYNWTIDAGDSEGYASTFTPDGVFNANVGHDAIVKFSDAFHAGLGARVRHWNTNLLIQPSPTGANGQVYLVLVDFSTKPASIVASASYTDELVKTSQGWRFKKRISKGDVAAPTKPQ